MKYKIERGKPMLKNKKNTRKQTRIIKKASGITLIALVVTIIVLLILAGISIMMLTGNNGILTRAGFAKDETIVGQEKEQVELAYVSAAIKKLGDSVSSSELQTELNNSVGNGKTVVTGTGTLYVHFNETKHNYTVGQNNKVARIADGDELPQTITHTVTTLANSFKKITIDVPNVKPFEELSIEELEILLRRSNTYFDSRYSKTLREQFVEAAGGEENYDDFLRDNLNQEGISTEELTTRKQLEDAMLELFKNHGADVTFDDPGDRVSGIVNMGVAGYEEHLRDVLEDLGITQSFICSVKNKATEWDIDVKDASSFIATSNAIYQITVTTSEGEELVDEVTVSGITYESMTKKAMELGYSEYWGGVEDNSVASNLVENIWDNAQGNDNNLNDYEVYFNGNKIENSEIEAGSPNSASIKIKDETGSFIGYFAFAINVIDTETGVVGLRVPIYTDSPINKEFIKASEFIIVYDNVNHKMVIEE